MRKILAGLIIGVLVLAGCSAPADDNTKSANNTVSNEVNDTSIYFDRVTGEDKYTNYFETWETDSGGYNVSTTLYGMTETETDSVYSNVGSLEFLYSAFNNHTYIIDMNKLKVDFSKEPIHPIAIYGNTLYLMHAVFKEGPVSLSVSDGENPVVFINNTIEIFSTAILNGEIYFAAHTGEVSDEYKSDYIEGVSIFKITKSGDLVNFGTVLPLKASEPYIRRAVNLCVVGEKIYVQTSNGLLFEIMDNSITKLDFMLSNKGDVISNILLYQDHMYAVRGIRNPNSYTDSEQLAFERLYIVEWDKDYNVIAEYELPDNYIRADAFGAYISHPMYNLVIKEETLQITEQVTEYLETSPPNRVETRFYNYTFNPKTKELKNGTQFKTNEWGRIIK